MTVGAGVGVYLYALIHNPDAAEGGPWFWPSLGTAGVLGIAAVAQTATQLAKKAEQVVTEGGSR